MSLRLSAAADGGLRIMLVVSATAQSLTTSAIAEAIGMPYNHVAKVVTRLRVLGLVEATRGRGGGVRITVAGESATVGQVLRGLEARTDVAACTGGEHGDCALLEGCRLRSHLGRARDAFYAALDDTPIAALVTERQLGPVFATIGLRPSA